MEHLCLKAGPRESRKQVIMINRMVLTLHTGATLENLKKPLPGPHPRRFLLSRGQGVMPLAKSSHS